MKVYVAELVWNYDGAELLGVFKDKETAVIIGEERRIVPGLNVKRGDYVHVTEWEVEE